MQALVLLAILSLQASAAPTPHLEERWVSIKGFQPFPSAILPTGPSVFIPLETWVPSASDATSGHIGKLSIPTESYTSAEPCATTPSSASGLMSGSGWASSSGSELVSASALPSDGRRHRGRCHHHATASALSSASYAISASSASEEPRRHPRPRPTAQPLTR